jgi:hypothetical protein
LRFRTAMASPPTPQLQTYTGTLTLIDGEEESYLIGTLMMLDPTGSTPYDRAHVAAAYAHFSIIPGAQNRPTITVNGIIINAPSGLPVLHVVKA